MKIKKITHIERKIWIFIIVLMLSIFVSIGIFKNKASSTEDNLKPQNSQLYDKMHKLLEDSIKYVQANYININNKVELKSLIYGAIEGLYNATDNYWTLFYNEKEWSELWDRLTSKLVGIGVYIKEDRFLDGVPVIIQPIKGSPAYKQGLISLDKIIKIDGEETKGNNFEDNIDKITGKEGTEVKLTIERSINNTFEITIVREEVKIYTVESDMIDKEVGYLKLRRFSSESDQEMSQALDVLNKKGMKKLIIDLRGNPGGLLNVCINITDMFVDSGIICSTKGRRLLDKKTYKAKEVNTKFKDKPLIVLVNDYTASASEIFSGAIKDHNIGTIMGTQTYGKGMVASVMKLNSAEDDIGVSVIIQKYFTPNGTDINEVGITPDIISKPYELTDDDFFYLRKIRRTEENRDLVYEFVENTKNITEKKIKNFHKELLNNGYLISYDALKLEVIDERDRYFLKMYDLDTDRVLKEALDLISER